MPPGSALPDFSAGESSPDKKGSEKLLVSEVAKHLSELEQWTEEHGYESLRQMQGRMSLAHSPNPGALERSNYMRVLQSWRL
jgi:dihydroorotate dehydrogenase (fumarate)